MSITSLGVVLKVPSLGANLDPDTATYAANIAAAGGTISAAALNANNQLVRGLKAAGLWNLLHELYTFSGDFNAALVKLKTVTSQNTLTNNNFASGDFDESSGLKGNGTSKYLQTGFVPSTDLSDTDSSYGCFIRGENVSNGVILGAQETASSFAQTWKLLPLREFSGRKISSFAYSTDGGTRIDAPSAEEPAFIVASRLATTCTVYKNGASIVGTSAAGLGTRPTFAMFAFGTNVGGSAAEFSGDRCGLAFIGDGLSGAQAVSLYDVVLPFLQAMGRV